jgi:hypothetical protein
MSHDVRRRRAGGGAAGAIAQPRRVAPGRRTLTARLSGPPASPETPSQTAPGDAALTDRQPMVGPGYGSPIPPLEGASDGQPLPAHLAGNFGRRLGADLGGVRVHTGEESARLADSMDARAFTAGQDIHFGPGQYDPGSREGQRLLAHEVAHTVQGSATPASPATMMRASAAAEPHEVEADAAASALVDGAGPVRVSRAAPAEAIHRKPKDTDQAAAPYTPADQVEQVRLALRAATAAVRTAIAAASRAKTEAESHAALDRGAQSIDHHLVFARSQMDAIDPVEVKAEAASLADALADFMSQASGLEITSIQRVRAQSLTIGAWAQTSGEAPRAPAGRFGAADASRGIGLSLRAVRHLAEEATAAIAPQSDGAPARRRSPAPSPAPRSSCRTCPPRRPCWPTTSPIPRPVPRSPTTSPPPRAPSATSSPGRSTCAPSPASSPSSSLR